MTVLTRIRLDSASRGVTRELADPVAVHRRTMSAFKTVEGSPARETLGVLWRVDTDSSRRSMLLVQSNEPGDWNVLPDGWVGSVDTKNIDGVLDSLRSGQTLRFRLRANATRKINTKTGDDGVRRNGQRVPLRSTEKALEWLARHGQAAGFDLVEDIGAPSVDMRSESPASGPRTGGPVTVEAVRFEGLMVVKDAVRLAYATRTGIGPAKAFGCGLLSLAGVHRPEHL
jgi:CRISPR system Cascade subunit CasE